MTGTSAATRISDFRSDTVTKPTAAMRRAMAEADVGDDVYGEDPTINRLQEKAARIFRREAALFVPSGTMANQIAVKHFTNPGTEVIVEASGHSLLFEGGGLGLISGVQTRVLEGERGVIDPEAIMAAVNPTDDVHHPATSLVILENTHNLGGGTVLGLDYVTEVAERIHRKGIPLYIDGARIFNASAASGVPVSEFAARADMISCCLSKGLGAPVGSLLVGDAAAIRNGLAIRKPLGGAMRQAGILAAAGLIALESGPDLLAADHGRAQKIARGIASLPGILLDDKTVETNIIMAGTIRPEASKMAQRLAAEGVLIHALGPDKIRFVTHRDVNDEDVERVLAAMRKVCGEIFGDL
jgi:threonine aldolase